MAAGPPLALRPFVFLAVERDPLPDFAGPDGLSLTIQVLSQPVLDFLVGGILRSCQMFVLFHQHPQRC